MWESRLQWSIAFFHSSNTNWVYICVISSYWGMHGLLHAQLRGVGGLLLQSDKHEHNTKVTIQCFPTDGKQTPFTWTQVTFSCVDISNSSPPQPPTWYQWWSYKILKQCIQVTINVSSSCLTLLTRRAAVCLYDSGRVGELGSSWLSYESNTG